jgi:hypothetical protein
MKQIFKANKLSLYNEIGGDSMLGFIIISIAFYFLVYTIIATQNTSSVTNFFMDLIGKLQTSSLRCPQEIPPQRVKKRNVTLTKPAAH